MAELTDDFLAKIAAVHHPLRRRLIDLLALEGPATASALADRTGQRVGNISHHMKMLAAAGLAEEAPELAKDNRERWWRHVPAQLSWSLADAKGDPTAETVATAAEHANLAHHVDKVQDWFRYREDYDDGWVRAAFSTESWVRATPEELEELAGRLQQVIEDFTRSRPDDGRPREHVFVFAHGVPGRP